MTRPDLLALTHDDLAALTNRGLVKRAAKEVDAAPPSITVEADGTVEATFADGARATLPPGGFGVFGCTCAAPGACRHRVGAVLAYQRQAEDAPAEQASWSPGDVDDDTLAARHGPRTIAAARRTLAGGFLARVLRPATVEMPAATVRFLVPGELGYVDCDARAERRDELTVLAVWAFREADRAHPGVQDVTVDIGLAAATASGSGIEDTFPLLDDLLRDGVSTSGPVLTAALARCRTVLDSRDLRWPVAALDDLVDQLTAYQERDARYQARVVAELVTELHARHRASTGGSPRTRVLGTDERADTPLKRVRLVSLGCRVHADGGVHVYLAHPAGGAVLVLRHRWETAGPLGARRIAGTTLHALAHANIVSESAIRDAGRRVRIGSNRVAKTAITPVGTAWDDLPAPIRLDANAILAETADLPPRLVRPRVAAEFVRVVPIAKVGSVAYHPGAQRLHADCVDPDGSPVTLSLPYRAHTPGALDGLARLLAEDPVAVSGTVRRHDGTVWVDPIAVATAAGVTVLDLLDDRAGALDGPSGAADDPMSTALNSAVEVLAEAIHRGLRHLPPTYPDRVTAAARTLDDVGLRKAGNAVRAFADDPGAWLDAQIRLLTTVEFR